MTQRLRPTTLLIAGLATAGLALSACGSDSLSSNSSSSTSSSSTTAAVDAALAAKLPAKIKSAGKIVIGTDATYQPNEYLDSDGKTVIGMDVELFDAVMAKFGVKTEWVPTGFDQIILGVTSGKYDVGVSSFTVNAEREKQATMVSYFKAGTQWVTQKGNPKKVDPENACGLSIAVQKATVQSDVDLPKRSKACTDAGKPAIKPIVDADQAKVDLGRAHRQGRRHARRPAAGHQRRRDDVRTSSSSSVSSTTRRPTATSCRRTRPTSVRPSPTHSSRWTPTAAYKAILTKWKTEGGAISDFAVNPQP